MVLTKVLQFDDDVLTVIDGMTWEQHGASFAGMIQGQLDRSLYVKVNKALAAMGGKWNRKRGAHIFKTDPRPEIDGLLDTGSLTVERDGYFPTPAPIGEAMARMATLKPGCVVLEPSAGTGELAEAILGVEPTALVICGEKNAARVDVLRAKGLDARQWDFLQYEGQHRYIIQNPPFEESQDIAHVLHAYDCLKPGGVLVSVMGEGAFFREDRKAQVFRQWLDTVRHDIVNLQAGAFHSSGTDIKARIVRIVRVGA